MNKYEILSLYKYKNIKGKVGEKPGKIVNPTLGFYKPGSIMKKKILIEGMSCGHCVKHAEEALKGINGVISVNVNLEEKNAVVELEHPVEDEIFKSAIDEIGYAVIGVEDI